MGSDWEGPGELPVCTSGVHFRWALPVGTSGGHFRSLPEGEDDAVGGRVGEAAVVPQGGVDLRRKRCTS